MSPSDAPSGEASPPQQSAPPPQASPAPPPLPSYCAHPHQQQHYRQVQQSWTPDGFVLRHNADIPPISNLLHREADAWRALLALHPSTVSAAMQLAQDNGPQTSIYYDDKAMNSDSREANYCAALTALASQCDNLHAEILKLRTFRKARRQMEVECAREVLRAHSDEVLAVGQTLASNGALNVASATAELRGAIQHQRSQVSHLRTLLQALESAKTLPLPAGGGLAVGLLREPHEEGETVRTWVGVEKLMAAVYADSRELNESSLSSALGKTLCVYDSTKPVQGQRQYARRPGERKTEPDNTAKW